MLLHKAWGIPNLRTPLSVPRHCHVHRSDMSQFLMMHFQASLMGPHAEILGIRGANKIQTWGKGVWGYGVLGMILAVYVVNTLTCIIKSTRLASIKQKGVPEPIVR